MPYRAADPALGMAVAAAIRRRLRERGMSYEALAGEVDRDTKTIATYLTSNPARARAVPLALLPAIAAALDTTATELVREAEGEHGPGGRQDAIRDAG